MTGRRLRRALAFLLALALTAPIVDAAASWWLGTDRASWARLAVVVGAWAALAIADLLLDWAEQDRRREAFRRRFLEAVAKEQRR